MMRNRSTDHSGVHLIELYKQSFRSQILQVEHNAAVCGGVGISYHPVENYRNGTNKLGNRYE